MDYIELESTQDTKTLQTKVVELLDEKNFTQFEQILDNNDGQFDVNHFYDDDSHNGTLLDIACRSSGNHEFVKKLLEHGAEINRLNEKSGLAPIHEAVQKSDVDTVNVLLADEKCNVHILDTKYYTPFLRAALAGRRDILSTLLKNQKVTLVQWTAENVSEITELWIGNANNFPSPDEEDDDTPPMPVCNYEQYDYSSVFSSSDESDNRKHESITSTCSSDDTSDSSSPQIRLLHSLKNQNSDEFGNILAESEDTVDVNYIYDHPENGTLLDIACRTTNNSEFIKLLKDKKAQINYKNPTRHGRSPLHTAVEFADEETLKILLDYENCDVNITDDYGDTPLHIAAKRDNPRAAQILLEQEKIQINKHNHKHESALYLALKRNHLGIVRQLLKFEEIQLDTGHNPRDLSCRKILEQKLPQWEKESQRCIRNPQISELFSYLYEHRTEFFIDKIDSNVFESPTADDGFHTYLQYACDRGFCDVVDKLLELNVNPNEICKNNSSTPIMISAAKGYHKIVARLLKAPEISLNMTNKDEETVLHTLVRGLLAFQATNQPKDPERDYLKCLRYILHPISELVNCPDIDGNIALYYAAKSNDKNIVLLLLRAGSYVCHKNHKKEVVLEMIDSKILEKYLDGCISTNDESSEQSDYQITLNCEIFKPPVGNPGIPEISPLLALNKVPDSKYLLKHPVLTSFLDLKWHILKKFYYINLFLHYIFLIFLLAYVYILVYHPESYSRDYNSTEISMIFIILILCTIFIFKEFMKVYISSVKYLSLIENWFDLCLVIATISLFICDRNKDRKITYQLAAIAIFTSFFKLFFIIGKHPKSSTNTQIFRTVSWNFIKFLGCYVFLILAFTSSFFVLCKFYNTMDKNSKCVTNNSTWSSNETESNNITKKMTDDQKDGEYPMTYHAPETSFIRSFMMMTGDFGAGCIPNKNNFDSSHVLFFLFVFIITIVLQNLLNGMAVDDIKKIRKNAQLLAIVSLIRFAWYVENATAILDFLKRCGQRYPETVGGHLENYTTIFLKMTRLFPNTLPDFKIRIMPNENNAVMFAEATDSLYLKYSSWKIDVDIARSTVKILQDKKSKENKKLGSGKDPQLE